MVVSYNLIKIENADFKIVKNFDVDKFKMIRNFDGVNLQL